MGDKPDRNETLVKLFRDDIMKSEGIISTKAKGHHSVTIQFATNEIADNISAALEGKYGDKIEM